MNIFVRILQGIPLWVYVVFFFLLYRGVSALRPREIHWAQMLLLPVIFFIWALFGIGKELHSLVVGYGSFFLGFPPGFFIGWFLFRSQHGIVLDRTTGKIRRPGTPITLVLILMAFVAKFLLMFWLAQQKSLAHDFLFCVLFGGVSGLIDGVFWGVTVVQFCLAQRAPVHQ